MSHQAGKYARRGEGRMLASRSLALRRYHSVASKPQGTVRGGAWIQQHLDPENTASKSRR